MNSPHHEHTSNKFLFTNTLSKNSLSLNCPVYIPSLHTQKFIPKVHSNTIHHLVLSTSECNSIYLFIAQMEAADAKAVQPQYKQRIARAKLLLLLNENNQNRMSGENAMKTLRMGKSTKTNLVNSYLSMCDAMYAYLDTFTYELPEDRNIIVKAMLREILRIFLMEQNYRKNAEDYVLHLEKYTKPI